MKQSSCSLKSKAKKPKIKTLEPIDTNLGIKVDSLYSNSSIGILKSPRLPPLDTPSKKKPRVSIRLSVKERERETLLSDPPSVCEPLTVLLKSPRASDNLWLSLSPSSNSSPLKTAFPPSILEQAKIKAFQQTSKRLQKALKEFVALIGHKPILKAKFTSESLICDDREYSGALSALFETHPQNTEIQVEIVLLLKFRKFLRLIERMEAVCRQPLLTQFSFDDIFKSVQEIASETFMVRYFIKGLELIGNIQLLVCEINGAVKTFKKLLIISDLFNDFRGLHTAYFQLAKCYQQMGEYSEAQVHYEKYLQTSWFLGDVLSELKAYDLIGMTFFYQNDLDKAQRYHVRSLSPDSALENPDFKLMIKNRIKDEEHRKQRMLSHKDEYFLYEVAKELLNFYGATEDFVRSKELKPYLSSNFAVETQSVLGPSFTPQEPKKGSQLFHHFSKKEYTYKADFTPEGYLAAMEYTNPTKYTMIVDGTLKLDADNIKGIDLYDKTYSQIESLKMLSHLSPNNSRQVFSSEPGPEMCIEFIKKDLRESLKKIIDQNKEELRNGIKMISVKYSQFGNKPAKSSRVQGREPRLEKGIAFSRR